MRRIVATVRIPSQIPVLLEVVFTVGLRRAETPLPLIAEKRGTQGHAERTHAEVTRTGLPRRPAAGKTAAAAPEVSSE
jgi:hypothetical protein